MKNNKTQPKAVQGTAMAKNAGPTVNSNANALVVLKPIEPTPEDLKAENERLRKQLETVPTNLQDRIAYYDQKKDWINKLGRIVKEENKLKELLEEVGEKIEEDEFLNDTFAFAIVRKKTYGSDEELLKISNPVVVGDALHVVLKRLQDKKDELEINIAS